MKQKQTSGTGGWFGGIFAWVFSLLLTLLTVMGVIFFTISNENYLKSQILSSGYAESILENLQENFTSYGNAGGMPAEVMTSFLTQEKVQQDLFRSVERFYQGQRSVESHPEIAQMAQQAMLESVQERGLELTGQVEEAIAYMAEICQTDYQKNMRFTFAPWIAAYMPKIVKLAQMGAGAVLVVTLIAFALLMAVLRNGPARLRWLINACGATALVSVILPVLFRIFVPMEDLVLSPVALKTLLVKYTQGMTDAFFYFTLIYLVVAGALYLVWNKGFQKSRQMYQNRQEQEFV